MFTETKLFQIRNGVRIRMKTLKYWVDIINRQNTNTWIHLKAYNNSIIDIRNVFRKFSLRVNRIVRVGYGPFTLGKASKPGDINQVSIPRTVGNYFYQYKKEKLNEKYEKVNKTKLKIEQSQQETTEQRYKEALRVLKNYKTKQNNGLLESQTKED